MNTITLTREQVAALVAETKVSAEEAVSSLMSVLCARKVWARLESSIDAPLVVFSYTNNVPTLNGKISEAK